jgi:hypothetical protein
VNAGKIVIGMKDMAPSTRDAGSDLFPRLRVHAPAAARGGVLAASEMRRSALLRTDGR